MSKINQKFLKLRKNHPLLIASHRGLFGGGIIENTLESFQFALQSKANIIEMDVVCSKDGEYFVFHDTEEPRLLGFYNNIHSLTSQEIKSLHYLNRYGFKTSKKINPLKEVLIALKGSTIINLDRCYIRGKKFLYGVLELIDELDMFDQIIIKSPPQAQFLDWIETYPVKLMYMPIVTNVIEIDQIITRQINTIGFEMVFTTDQSPLISQKLLKKLKEKGYALWVNALSIDESYPLAAGHDDTCSLVTSINDGWHHLIELGFDIIQTDWPAQLSDYIMSVQQ